jgi:hypothetical protein
MAVVGADGRLGRYLLGTLPPEEEEALELEYLAGDDALALVQEAEDDLVDDYARGLLSSPDARRFEERLLPRPGMAARVAFARALAAQKRPKSRRLAPPWLAWAAALLLAVLSTGLGSGLHRLRQAAAADAAAARERITALERTVTEQQLALRAAVPPPAAGTPPVVELRDNGQRGSARSGPNEIPAPDAPWIVLRLLLDEHLYPSYVVRIETDLGRVITTLPVVRRDAPAAAEVMVPGALLKAGAYVVMLEGVDGAERDTVGGFPLQVRRR